MIALLLVLIFAISFLALFFPQLYRQVKNTLISIINQVQIATGLQKNIYMGIFLLIFLIILLTIFLNQKNESFRTLQGDKCNIHNNNEKEELLDTCGTKHLNQIADPYYSSDRLNEKYMYENENDLTPYINSM